MGIAVAVRGLQLVGVTDSVPELPSSLRTRQREVCPILGGADDSATDTAVLSLPVTRSCFAGDGIGGRWKCCR